MYKKAMGCIAAAALAAGCVDVAPSGPERLGAEAADYLHMAVDVMELNSIAKYRIDWADFRTLVFADAGSANRAADTYPAIRRALARIGDDHSFFQSPGERASAEDAARPGSPLQADPVATVVAPDVAYVDVPAFSGEGVDADRLAARYHRLIAQMDGAGVCGWVVDLRGNTGGNMWPMLAGIGPILGEGEVGFFVDPDSVVHRWSYGRGVARLDGGALVRADAPYAPADPLRPVAVLTDRHTASAGEAVAVAFRGRPASRSFGEETFGVSTVNAAFGMPDGAAIFLTVARAGDRLGQVYGGRLTPDSRVTGRKTGDPATDAALAAAVQWLRTMDCGS